MRYEFRPLVAWTDPVTTPRRGSHVFKASWADTLTLLGEEIDRIGGKDPVVFQIDVQEGDIRLDGMLRANAKVGHPGVVISFESKFGPLRYATDAHERQYSYALPGWQANIRAIALALAALRAVDRYGVTKRGEQYTGWKALPGKAAGFSNPFAAADWMRKYASELNISLAETSTPDGKSGGWPALYRAMARKMHPDNGGPRADWDRLDEARQAIEGAGWMNGD